MKAFYETVAFRVADWDKDQFDTYEKTQRQYFVQDGLMGDATAKTTFIVQLGVKGSTRCSDV